MVGRSRKKQLDIKKRMRERRSSLDSSGIEAKRDKDRRRYQQMSPVSKAADSTVMKAKMLQRISSETNSERKRRISNSNASVVARIKKETIDQRRSRLDYESGSFAKRWRRTSPDIKRKIQDRNTAAVFSRRAFSSDAEKSALRSADSSTKRRCRTGSLGLPSKTLPVSKCRVRSKSSPDQFRICQSFNVSRAVTDFATTLSDLHFRQCNNCEERSPFLSMSAKDSRLCVRCSRSSFKFSAENDMDPGSVPEELFGLSMVEQLLIAQASAMVKVYRLPYGQTGYRGHVIAFPQDIASFAKRLPRKVSDIDIIVVRKQGTRGAHKDFRVRRERVVKALVWLKKHNSQYMDIELDQSVIDKLPVDDLIDFDGVDVDEDKECLKYAYQDDVDVASDPNDLTSSFVPLRVNKVTESLETMHAADKLLHRAGASSDVPPAWPEIDISNPINEFKSPGYLVRCFPTLFPYGKADYLACRKENVYPQQYFEHLLLYKDGRFARHPFFRYFALNTITRWNALKAGSVFLQQHPDERRWTVTDLCDMTREQKALLVRQMLHFSKTFRGSRGFWNSKRGEIVGMIEQLGMPHVFFTLSAADTHWPELHKLLPGYRSKMEALNDNPHIADEFFHFRIQEYFKTVLSVDLGFEDYWFRYEYQHRGSPHVHGVAWILGAPAISGIVSDGEGRRDDELISFIDSIMSTWNPSLDEVGQGSVLQPVNHPSGVELMDVLAFDIEGLKRDYASLVNTVERHTSCRENTCLRSVKKKKGQTQCRFGFPKELQPVTIIRRERNQDGWCYEYVTERNDQRVNSHHPHILMSHRANHDIQVIVDYRKLVAYIVKYATKEEPRSYPFVEIFQNVLRSHPVDASLKKVVQALFLKIVEERDISSQECWHLLRSLPLVSCSRTFKHLNTSGTRKIDASETAKDIIQSNDLDNFMQRPEELEKESLFSLYRDYFVSKKNGSVMCSIRSKPAIIIVHPFISDDPTRPTYEEYCKQSLMLYKPFRKLENLRSYGCSYAVSWKHFAEAAGMVVDRWLWKKRVDVEPVDISDKETDESENLEMDEWMQLLQLRPEFSVKGDSCFPEHDWTEHSKMFNLEYAKDFAQSEKSSIQAVQLYGDISQLNDAQLRAYNLITGPRDGSIRLIVYGPAGTGKTFLMGCLRLHFGNKAKLVAPTGVAAFNIGGQTLHAALKIPVRSDGGFVDLTGEPLNELQEMHKDVEIYLIDEVSMVGRMMMGKIDKRLRQAFPMDSDKVFGNCSVVFFGDFAQLDPVLDKPLWASEGGSKLSDMGRSAYVSINKAVVLTEVVRQSADPKFRDILMRVRNMLEVTKADYDVLTTRFSDRLNKDDLAKFANSPRIFTKKEAVSSYNIKKLMDLKKPIANIRAIHSGLPGASSCSSDEGGGLAATLLLSEGAKVMLLKNLWTDAGLCNGAVGFVYKIVYIESSPPDLPDCVLCAFPNYKGVPFDASIPGSFPIFPIVATFILRGSVCSRKTLPLQLAFAITTHKKQGSTEQSAYISLGDREFSAGLTYTSLSRVQSLSGLLLEPFSFQRLVKRGKGDRLVQRLCEERRIYELDGFTSIPSLLLRISGEIKDDKSSSRKTSVANFPVAAVAKKPLVGPFLVDGNSERVLMFPVDYEWKKSLCLRFQLKCEALQTSFRRKRHIFNRSKPVKREGNYVVISGHGDCFFKAISFVITGSENSHMFFRQRVANLAIDHFDAVTEVFGNSHHLREIKNQGVWAETSDVYLMAYDLQTKIFVFRHHQQMTGWTEIDPTMIEGLPSVQLMTDRAIYLDNENEDHFNVVLNVV